MSATLSGKGRLTEHGAFGVSRWPSDLAFDLRIGSSRAPTPAVGSVMLPVE